MIGPRASVKTEISRRLAKLAHGRRSSRWKLQKFTEVGYVGPRCSRTDYRDLIGSAM